MKLSMVMIAHNEADNIKKCFDAWWDDVDEVVLVDDGSTDDTLEKAKQYALKKGAKWVEGIKDDVMLGDTADPNGSIKWIGEPKAKLRISRYRKPSDELTNDFAALRNYADSLATGDWRTWCDLDDEVVGLANLRKLAEEADPSVYQFYVHYEYGIDDYGNCVCELWRERMVKATAPTQGWQGRVHECQIIAPPMVMVDKDVAVWRHHNDLSQLSERNEKLLWEWVDAEPENSRALSYLAFELMAKRIRKERPNGTVDYIPDYEALQASVPMFQRYLQMPGENPEQRAQAARRMSQVLIMVNNFDAAFAVSSPMLAEVPFWPDTKLTLAEIAHERREWQKCVEFAKQVYEQGPPQTTLILNPTDYTLRPLVLMASALAECGRLEDAVKASQQVVAKNPFFMGVGAQHERWLTELSHEQAAGTWVNCAQMLVQHDEPEKALVLLATVPFFIFDHPQIVAARVMVSRTLEEPYQIEIVGDSPRGKFLVLGLKEQQEQGEAEAERIRKEREEDAAAVQRNREAMGDPVIQHPEETV